MLRLCSIRCPHMNQITLEMTRDALKHMQYVTEVPEETRVRADRGGAANAGHRLGVP